MSLVNRRRLFVGKKLDCTDDGNTGQQTDRINGGGENRWENIIIRIQVGVQWKGKKETKTVDSES